MRRYARRKKLREFVEDQIRLELLARAGVERGLANDPEVVRAARSVMVRKLLRSDLGPTVGGGDVPAVGISLAKLRVVPCKVNSTRHMPRQPARYGFAAES